MSNEMMVFFRALQSGKLQLHSHHYLMFRVFFDSARKSDSMLARSSRFFLTCSLSDDPGAFYF